MAMQIDLTKQLNEGELRYLIERDRWDDIRENARNLGKPEPALPSARGIRMQTPRRQLRNVAAETAFKGIADQLGVSVATEDETEQPPANAAENPPPPSDPQPVDYSRLTVPQLKEEMDKRRTKYERDGDKEGVDLMTYASDARKDDLVSALKLDDEQSEDDGDDS